MKNLFGKTLVVLIFTFSLALLSMSGIVYMTHTDWRARAEALEKDVQAASKKIEGDGTQVGYRAQNIQLKHAVEDEEALRLQVVGALESEVKNRQAEYDGYQELVQKQDKELRTHVNEMTRYTLALLKLRVTADDTLIRMQNERNERIRSVHEYVRNMNQIEDLSQQIQTLEKRARGLTLSRTKQ